MQSTDVKKPAGDWNPTAGSTDRAIVPNPACTGNSPLALASTAIQNAALRFWFATPSRWLRGTIRTGARHATKQAGNLPDSEVFSRSESMVSGLGVLIRKDGSTTCFVCLHPAPPNGLDSHCVGFQFNKERETMTTSPVASRSAAPASPAFDPVATHFEAVNACAMARWYAARYEHTKAARKAAQGLSALRKLQAFEATSASPCTNCPDNRPLPSGPLDFFDTPVVAFAIERRTACTLCPTADKPCLKGGAA